MRAFAAEGAHVIIADVEIAKAEALAANSAAALWRSVSTCATVDGS